MSDNDSGTISAWTLGDIAHARTGDKGDTSLIVVVPYEAGGGLRLAELLTPTTVAKHFGLEAPSVEVHGPTREGVLILVLSSRLFGGVTRSLSPDPHGKTLASHLLEMSISK